MRRTVKVFRDGWVHVQAKQCQTCIFRPGNLMSLEEGRVEQMVADAGDEGCIPCHEFMDTKAPGVCKGFYNQHRNDLLRLAEVMGRVKFQ